MRLLDLDVVSLTDMGRDDRLLEERLPFEGQAAIAGRDAGDGKP